MTAYLVFRSDDSGPQDWNLDPSANWDLEGNDVYPVEALAENPAQEVARLRGLLARLEWPETLPGAGPWHICPICSNHRDQGHEPDCWLAAELGRTQNDAP